MDTSLEGTCAAAGSRFPACSARATTTENVGIKVEPAVPQLGVLRIGSWCPERARTGLEVV